MCAGFSEGSGIAQHRPMLWQSVPSGKSGSVQSPCFSGVETPKTAGQPAPELPLGSKQYIPWGVTLAAPEKSGRGILYLTNLAGSQQPVRVLVSLFANFMQQEYHHEHAH